MIVLAMSNSVLHTAGVEICLAEGRKRFDGEGVANPEPEAFIGGGAKEILTGRLLNIWADNVVSDGAIGKLHCQTRITYQVQ